MEEIRRSPPNMYETLQRMGYLPYELVNAGFLNQQQYHLFASESPRLSYSHRKTGLRMSRKFTDANGIQQTVANLGCLGATLVTRVVKKMWADISFVQSLQNEAHLRNTRFETRKLSRLFRDHSIFQKFGQVRFWTNMRPKLENDQDLLCLSPLKHRKHTGGWIHHFTASERCTPWWFVLFISGSISQLLC